MRGISIPPPFVLEVPGEAEESPSLEGRGDGRVIVLARENFVGMGEVVEMDIFFASVDGRVERRRARCIHDLMMSFKQFSSGLPDRKDLCEVVMEGQVSKKREAIKSGGIHVQRTGDVEGNDVFCFASCFPKSADLVTIISTSRRYRLHVRRDVSSLAGKRYGELPL